MANISAGNKRSWEGNGSTDLVTKRYRHKDDYARDWRDVHLRSPVHHLDRKRDSPDDRRDRDYRRDSPRRRRSRDRDHKRRDYSRDRVRRSDRRRSASPRISAHIRSPVDDEREEGEISPPPARAKPEKFVQNEEPLLRLEPAPEMELEIPPTPPPVEDMIATRRAKRQAILAKYSGQDASSIPLPMSNSIEPPPELPVSEQLKESEMAPPDGKRDSLSRSPEPSDFALAKAEDDDADHIAVDTDADNQDQILAADYDPSLDRREDEQKRIGNAVVGSETRANDEVDEVEEVEEEEEDLDDMFVAATGKKSKKIVKKVVKNTAPALITTTTLDSAADPEGYYSIILGEQLDNGRYQVFSSLGKGMFANVVRSRVLCSGESSSTGEVAIKIVRCQESMYKAGQKEIQILQKIRQADPEDKKHIVRLERTFEHRGHLCLVFESLSMNLRDVVKRFGKDVGLNIRAVRAYAHQLFLALSLLRKLNIIHADIKPDNILVNEQKTLVKLCDLGSASDAAENEITPYLVSRFYRAPEIIFGIPYDAALDIWSIGCTLYELYTGKILFPGRSNNQMLLLMMELKGRFNSKMIKKAKFGDVYFDEMGGFLSVERGAAGGGDVVRSVHISKPTRDLRARLIPRGIKGSDEEIKMLNSFVDLLDKCLVLDPGRRIQPREALVHPFIRGI
ncbi:U4/U6 small nuclear ribonucleoprotein prp4 [Leucoagaricus gongylophorus]